MLSSVRSCWLPLVWLALAGTSSIADAQVRDRISVVGSSTVFPYAAAVAEAFGRQGRWKTPVIESTGTGSGFRLFCKGVEISTPDVNTASRPMTDAERELCARHGVRGVLGLRIGTDGIVVASGRRLPPFDLTLDQLYRAVARQVPVGGKLIDNPYHLWSEVGPGLPRRPISVLGPATNHGTRDVFVALVMVPACEQYPQIHALPVAERRAACQTVREDGPWIDVASDYSVLLGRLRDETDAIGILGYAYLEQNRADLQVARIDGIAPTLGSIGSWKYPLSRPLFIYVKTAHAAAVPGLAEFVREFLSDRAAGPQGYLIDKGMAPTSSEWLASEREKARALGAAGP